MPASNDHDGAGQTSQHDTTARENGSSPLQGSTGPVGEPGLPPSRQVALGTGSPSAGSRAGAVSPTQSHIRNITSPTFFQPMSSKQQNHLISRPKSPPVPETPHGRPSTETTSTKLHHRSSYSNASIITMEPGHRPPVDDDVPPLPASRDEIAERYPNNTQMNLGSLRSQSSSVPLNPNKQKTTAANGAITKAQRSSKSIRRSLGWKSQTSKDPREAGHKKLDSAPTSPEWDSEKPTSSSKLGRNYEYYNGNAIFFLRGRLINTRQTPLSAITAFLAILPAAFFFIFSASYLWHAVSPAIPITFAYLFFLVMSSFLHASFSDPGVLPRNMHPLAPDASDEDPLALGQSRSDWVMVKPWDHPAGDEPATALEVPIKYCDTCKIWRPPRAHHCRECNACVETQDHHCVWLNNCVGRRNYRYFFTFVFTGPLLALYLLGGSLTHILVFSSRHNVTFAEAVRSGWTRQGALAMVIYAILVFPYPAALWGYHVFLTLRGESTREYLNSQKFLKRDRHRPFNRRSLFWNAVDVLCRPRPPTYMQFKNKFSEGDQRLEPERVKRSRKASVEMHQIQASSGATTGPAAGSGSHGFQGPQARSSVNSTPRKIAGSAT